MSEADADNSTLVTKEDPQPQDEMNAIMVDEESPIVVTNDDDVVNDVSGIKDEPMSCSTHVVTPDTKKKDCVESIEVNCTTGDEKQESPLEEKKYDHQDDITPKVEITPFSQEDDEALARMLQKEEEELAAAADIEYEFTIVSPKAPEVDDVWEEVKKRRKKHTIVEEQ